MPRGRKPGCGRHNKHKTPEYKAWEHMKARCSNPMHPKYKNYGGRGIEVCDRWQDFVKFWIDVGPRPSKEHSLDRINNDGNYEPGNVRWATRKQQMNNQTNTRRVCWMGIDRPITEWSEILGVNYGTLSGRYRKNWTAEEILFGKI